MNTKKVNISHLMWMMRNKEVDFKTPKNVALFHYAIENVLEIPDSLTAIDTISGEKEKWQKATGLNDSEFATFITICRAIKKYPIV